MVGEEGRMELLLLSARRAIDHHFEFQTYNISFCHKFQTRGNGESEGGGRGRDLIHS
jgi:hypothetical protein